MDARVLKIGECWLDVGRHGIVRDGELIHIEPRDFTVLIQLVESAPNIVSSNSLLRNAWRDKEVGDNALHQAIGRLRKALGDHARRPIYIQTQSKLGYQFIAPVVGVASDLKDDLEISPIAVLPFKDYSDEPCNPYFVDGLCFELCNQLLNLDLQVISLDRAARVQRRGFTDLEVGGRIGARSVLSGSVMVVGEEIRVTAHLGDVETERQLWSDKYDRKLGQIFATHTEIAEQIVKNMMRQDHRRRVTVASTVMPLRADERRMLSRDRRR
ncbi:MAG: winged helix-turn-helix domain-containing protein [Pseudomonadota bacterium]